MKNGPSHSLPRYWLTPQDPGHHFQAGLPAWLVLQPPSFTSLETLVDARCYGLKCVPRTPQKRTYFEFLTSGSSECDLICK